MEELVIHFNNLCGKWINRANIQKVQIYYPDNETYSVEYDPPLLLNEEGKNEAVRIMPISIEEHTIKFTNCLGSWNLKLLSKDKFEVHNLSLIHI